MFRRKTWFISADFTDVFYFICGIIWIVDRFMLLVYMYFGDKESISLDVDFLYEYQVFVSLCFIAQWYNFYKSYCS